MKWIKVMIVVMMIELFILSLLLIWEVVGVLCNH